MVTVPRPEGAVTKKYVHYNTGASIGFLSDHGNGDFLFLHADIQFGKYALVVFLNRKWDASYRGILTLYLDGEKTTAFLGVFQSENFP